MRPMKVVGWVLAGVVALLLLGMLAVMWFVDPNDYKDDVAKAVRDKTGRELVLQGDLKLSFFPWLALETGHAELGNPEGFGPGPFMSLDQADVGVKLLPLLGGRLEVRRLKLEGLTLNLVKDEQGRTNWQDLTESKQPASGETTSSSSASVGGLTVLKSALDYRDLGTGAHYRVSNLNLETSALRSGAPFDLDLGLSLDQGEGSARTDLKLKTQATLDTEAQRYGAKDLALNVTLKGAERAQDQHFDLSAPAIESDLKAETLSIPRFVLRVGSAEINGELQGAQIIKKPVLTGAVALKPVSLRDLLRDLGREAPQTRDPKALGTFSFESKLQASGDGATLDGLKLTLDDTHVTGRFAYLDFKHPHMDLDFTVDQLDLDRYQPPEDKKAKATGPDQPFELPMSTLKSLNARGTLAVGTLTMAGIKMSAVKLTLNAEDGLVRLNPVLAKLYGGAHRGNVAIDARGQTAKLSIEETVSNVDLAPLMADLLDSKRLSGRGNANAVLAARGNNSDALMHTLDGRMDFNVANGALEGRDLWYEVRRARALWKRQAAPAKPSVERTPFRALKGTATVTKGVLDNRDLDIDMDYLKAAGKGTFDLNTKTVDYQLVTSIYRVPEEGAGAEMKDLQSKSVPVRVTGTLDDMKFRPDLDAIATAEVKEQVAEKLKDKLNKWLGKKPN